MDEIPANLSLPSNELGARAELDVLMQQWTSVRQQGDLALSGQLSALSLGIAAISVLVAAIGTIWSKAPLAACAGLMAVVPPVAMFVALVWGTEIKKTLRASSFLRNVAEPRVNALFVENIRPLTWESDGYKYGRIAPYYVSIVVFLLATGVVSYFIGLAKFEHIRGEHSGWLWSNWWPVIFGAGNLGLPIIPAGFIVTEALRNIRERP